MFEWQQHSRRAALRAVPCCRGAGAAEEYGVRAAAVDITPARLKELLTYPSEWGPTEWGTLHALGLLWHLRFADWGLCVCVVACGGGQR